MASQDFDSAGSPLRLFGGELRHYRTRAGLSQDQLGARVYCSGDEGLRGPLMIADFEDAPSAAYLDTAVRGQIVDDRDDIDAVRVTWDTLMSEALSRSASRDLVEEVGKTWT